MAAPIAGDATGAMASAASVDRRAVFFDRWVEDLPPAWQDAAALTLLVLAVAPADGAVLDRRASGALLRSLLADPVYQLK